VVDRKKGKLEVFFAPIVTDGKSYKALSSFMLRVCSAACSTTPMSLAAKNTKSRASNPPSIYADHSVLSTGKWAKISVKESGLHVLTPEMAKKAGFSDINKVRIFGYGGNLQPEAIKAVYLRATDDLQEVRTCKYNNKLYFRAFGSVHYDENRVERIRNPYSDYGYYFITDKADDGTAPLCETDTTKYKQEEFATEYEEQKHFLYENDNFSWYYGGRNLYDQEPIEVGKSKTYQLKLGDYFAPKEGLKYTATIVVTAGSASSFEVLLDDVMVGQGRISLSSYDVANQKSVTFDFETSNPNITIKAKEGGPLRLDYIDVKANVLKKIPAISSAQVPEAQYVYNITNQDLHADHDYDMVIIIPTTQKLRSQADRLKDFHEKHDGLKVRVVPADEIFNEFSSGTPDANAYRRYMKML
ncbi:MAG: Por secretion system protein, partial [Bacteroidaceae bacterium]|nr:Por secretion system protein [Bacteroidaceae bacterium]